MDGEAHVAHGDQRIERDLSRLFVQSNLRAHHPDFPEHRHGFEGAGPPQIGTSDDAAAFHLKISFDDFGPGEPVFSVANPAAFFGEFAGRHAQQFRGHRFALSDRFAARLHHSASHQRRRSAGARGTFEECHARVGTDQPHFFQRNAHLLRGNLCENRVTPLAELRASAEH